MASVANMTYTGTSNLGILAKDFSIPTQLSGPTDAVYISTGN